MNNINLALLIALPMAFINEFPSEGGINSPTLFTYKITIFY